jgi:hypothetical protein
VRHSGSIWERPQLFLIAGVLGSLVFAFGLASPARGAAITIFGALSVLALVWWLPPHLFLAANLAILALSSRFGTRPITVGSASVYTFDLVMALVLLRALLPRERRKPELRLLEARVAAPAVIWSMVMLAAGIRGVYSGNGFGAVLRLETPFVYFPLAYWGFTRILREARVSIPWVVRALALTGLGFIAYAAYARLTGHRFGGTSGSGIGDVQTTGGVLRRDYGIYSAFQIYPLLALGALSYLIFSRRRASWGAIVVSCVAVTATVLTLIRGLIFGVAAGASMLVILAVKTRWVPKLGRLLPLVAALALAVGLFFKYSPTAARGVTDRLLPGIAAQTQGAIQTQEVRAHAFSAGKSVANDHPFGTGFVTHDALQSAGYRSDYIPDTQWGTLLAYTGWPGVLALLWVGFAVVRRSSRLPAAAPWLHPLVAATAVLLLVQGWGWDVLFAQTWSIGMAALILALRFGLVPNSSSSPERTADWRSDRTISSLT